MLVFIPQAYHLRREETDWFEKARDGRLENGQDKRQVKQDIKKCILYTHTDSVVKFSHVLYHIQAVMICMHPDSIFRISICGMYAEEFHLNVTFMFMLQRIHS